MAKTNLSTEELLDKNSEFDFMLKAQNFYHYTSIEKLDKILDNKSFHVSNATKLNDLNEFKGIDVNKEKLHILCFCNSKTEMIPMWYLYAGISGQGANIGVTLSKMKDFIDSIQTISVVGSDKKLKKDRDFDLQYGYVYYRNTENSKKIKYRGKIYEIDDEKKFIKNNYFIKDFPWEYEREFRIVIINKTNEIYEKIIIDIPDKCYKNLKLGVAPEIDDEKLISHIKRSQGLSKFLSTKIKKSELGIKMDLCKKDLDCFVEYLPNYNDEEISKICETINLKKKCLESKQKIEKQRTSNARTTKK